MGFSERQQYSLATTVIYLRLIAWRWFGRPCFCWNQTNGIELDLPMRQGQPSPQSSTSRGHSFNQAQPPQTAWTLWQKVCLLWSDTTGQLSQQLGMWLYPANELRRQWHAYYVPDDRLYIFQNT